MKGAAVLFAQPKTDIWATPQAFYDALHREFNFTLDPCANKENTKCGVYFTEEDDGLTAAWSPHRVFMNPPYSKTRDWMRKAYAESQLGATVVCLVPARTDTRWFHEFALKGEIRFVKGRLKFGDSKHNAPFPNVIVVFRP